MKVREVIRQARIEPLSFRDLYSCSLNLQGFRQQRGRQIDREVCKKVQGEGQKRWLGR